MLDPVLDPKPRGFSGRPLISLLSAVGLAVVGTYFGSRLQLTDPTVFVIIVAIVGAVGYLWHRADTRAFR
jgi:hypothetical protein